MLGRHAFPPIGDLPYLLTLPGHGFFWFRLAADAAPPDWHIDRAPAEDLPVLVLFDGWNSLFRQRVVPWRIGLADRTRAMLEDELLPRYLRRQRWFDGEDAITRVHIVDHALLGQGAQQWLLALMDGEAAAPAPPRWFLPLAIAFEDHDEERLRALAPVAVSRVRQQAAVGVLADAMADEAFCRALVEAVGSARTLAGERGRVRFQPGASFAALAGDAPAGGWPLLRLGTGTNSITLLGERLMLKAYRRLHPGVCPELEMARHLGDTLGFPHVVPLAGSVEYQREDGEPVVLALLQAQVAHQGDAWNFVVDQLTRLLEAHLAGTLTIDEALAPIAERITVMARRVAELHAALACRTGDAAFDPEPVGAADFDQWLHVAGGRLREALDCARARGVAPDAGIVAAFDEAAVRARGVPLAALRKTRVHGSLHLSEVLVVQDDFVLIDFEGDADVPAAERRAKHCALRDVAALRCAFDEAQHAALASMAQLASERDRLTAAARQWAAAMRAAFWRAYADAAVGAGLYPDVATLDALRPLLALFELDRAALVLRQAVEHRSEAVAQRLAALVDAAARHGD